jgi:hypothetical protein
MDDLLDASSSTPLLDAARASSLGGIGVAAFVPVLVLLAFQNPLDALIFFNNELLIHAIVVAFAAIVSFLMPLLASFIIAGVFITAGVLFVNKMISSQETPQMRQNNTPFLVITALAALVFFARTFSGDTQTARMYFSSPAFLSFSVLVVALASFVASVPRNTIPPYAIALMVFIAVCLAWYLPFKSIKAVTDDEFPEASLDHSAMCYGMTVLFVAFVSVYATSNNGDDARVVWALPAQVALVICGFLLSRAGNLSALVEITSFAAIILLLSQQIGWNDQYSLVIVALSFFLFFTSFTERNTGSIITIVLPLAAALTFAERLPQGPAIVVGASLLLFFRDRFAFSDFGPTRIFASVAITSLLLQTLRREEKSVTSLRLDDMGVDFAVFAAALLVALGVAAQSKNPLFQIAIGVATGAVVSLAPRPPAPPPVDNITFSCI